MPNIPRRKAITTENPDHDELEMPKSKRQRINQAAKTSIQKKRIQDKQGHLAGLMKMPIDIFTEVTSHLMPRDILILARSNKFFRNLLMRRSAIHIWHGAMRNVPNIPPCPLDMCEPQYLALIYLPECSMCGKSGPKRIDETLRVRLCNSCVHMGTMLTRGLPTDVQDLVHKSYRILWHDDSAIRSEVGEVLVKIAELNQSKESTALSKWKRERKEELITRQKEASVLSSFLNELEYQEVLRENEVKATRRAEIERRFIKLGCDKKDLELGYAGTREWKMVVEEPVPITESIWASIKPRLVQILQQNRTMRIADERLKRKSARRTKLEQILKNIKAADTPLIDIHIPSLAALSDPISATPSISDTASDSGSDSASNSTSRPTPEPDNQATRVSHKRVFPLAIDLLAYPSIKSLDETDIPDSEMDARFDERRGEIEARVSEWRIASEAHMAGILRKGRVADGLHESPPAMTLPVEESQPNPFDGVSDDLKILLRADSLFESGIASVDLPIYYEALLFSANYSLGWRSPRPQALDLNKYNRHAKAQEIARALLAEIGKPDASYLEFLKLGHIFKCERCSGGMTYNWDQLLLHYLEELQLWEGFQRRLPKAQELGITIQYLHALDIDKPLVQVLESPRYPDFDCSGLSNFQCLLCTKIGVYDGELMESEVVGHITKWHGVAEPKSEEHYIQVEHDSEDEDGTDSEDGYNPYGFGPCHQGCCAIGTESDDDEDSDEDEW